MIAELPVSDRLFPGFRMLDDHAREEAATIMDDLTEFMLPAYRHRR